MRVSGFTVAVLSGVVLAVAPSCAGENADSLYAAAMDSVGRAPLEASVAALERVLEADRKHAAAHCELAKLLLALDTPDDRRRAERLVRRAIRLEPGNEEFQLSLGDVMWARGFRSNANRQYHRVLKANPESPKASYWLGYRAQRDFLKYQSMRMLGGRVHVDQDRARAVHYLSRSIRLDPSNREAYYQLGLVHLESRNPRGLVAMARGLLARFPEDKDGLLFCALGYQRMGRQKNAHPLYAAALERMSVGERAVMESVDYLVPEGEATRLDGDRIVAEPGSTPAEWQESPEKVGWWREQDPLYLTEYNERRMAHYGRVAYANLRYGRPDDGVPGWKTDMGKIHIKFGRPLRKWAQRPQMSASSSALRPHLETWIYEDFDIRFRNWDGFENWQWYGYFADEALALLREGKWPAHPKEIFKREPPRYVDPFRSQKYSMPHLAVVFRDADSVRLVVACAVPRSKLSSRSGDATDAGYFLFDGEWNEACRRVVRSPTLVDAGPDSLKQQYLVAQHEVVAAPGAYTMVAEVGDRSSGSIGTFRESIVAALPDSGLAMSDLLVASRIAPRVPFPESRADLSILPNPMRTYTRTQPVFAYLEVYNLARDVFGRTDYVITYRVGPPARKEVDPAVFVAVDAAAPPAVVEREFGLDGGQDVVGGEGAPEGEEDVVDFAFPEVAGDAVVQPDYPAVYVLPPRNRKAQDVAQMYLDGEVETAVTARYEGERSDDFTYLQIDVARVPPGVHKLTVSVNDIRSGASAVRHTLFRIVE